MTKIKTMINWLSQRCIQVARMLVALIPILLSGCYSFNPERIVFQGDEVQFPIQVTCGLILIEASVNGGKPYWFILDTGSNVSILDQQNFPEPEFKPGQNIEYISSDNVRFENLDVWTVDRGVFASLEATSGLDIGGLLGYNMFSGHTLSLDYRNQLASISRTPVGLVNGSDILPMTKLGEGGFSTPKIESDIAGKKLPVIIDSGNPSWPSFSNFMTTNIDKQQLVTIASGVSGGAFEIFAGTLNGDIRFGQYKLETPTVDVLGEENPWGYDWAVFGESVLNNFIIKLDSLNRRVQFISHDDITLLPNQPYWHSGVGYGVQEETIIVNHLVPGTPAFESGIQIGDKVVSINGKTSGYCKDVSSITSINTDGQQILELIVSRNEMEMDFEVPMVKLFP